MAGARCAGNLVKAGLDVLVLDKSRGFGGRMSTRRVVHNDRKIAVDHGTQYITAKGDRFRQFVRQQLELGTMAEWTRTLHVLDDTGLHEGDYDDRAPRYCCPQGMTAVVKQMCESLIVERQTRITRVKATEDGWQIFSDDDRGFQARSLAIAIPAPQILEMLADWLTPEFPLYSPLSSALYIPCIAVMAGYGNDVATPVWKGVACSDDRVVWVSFDSSKRGADSPATVVVHSTPTFAEPYLDGDPDKLHIAGQELLTRAGERLGDWLAQPEWMQVHRWKYSLPAETLGMASLGTYVAAGSRSLPLVCAGDWCAGPKVEGAFISGEAAASRLLGMLKSS